MRAPNARALASPFRRRGSDLDCGAGRRCRRIAGWRRSRLFPSSFSGVYTLLLLASRASAGDPRRGGGPIESARKGEHLLDCSARVECRGRQFGSHGVSRRAREHRLSAPAEKAASWPGLSRPSTEFGATNDQKRVTLSESRQYVSLSVVFEATLRGWPGQARPRRKAREAQPQDTDPQKIAGMRRNLLRKNGNRVKVAAYEQP